MRRFRKQLSKQLIVVNGIFLSAQLQISAYAFTVKPDVTVDEFNNYTGDNVVGMLLGITFWICRLFGALVLMWGIYSVIVSKKDGDADSINIAIIKIIFGALLFAMPNIFQALGIIQ